MAFRDAQRRAKRKGLVFTITKPFVESKWITTCPLLLTPISKNNPASIDRIDPSKGYTPENTWVISFRANTLKSDMTIEEYERLVQNCEKQAEYSVGSLNTLANRKLLLKQSKRRARKRGYECNITLDDIWIPERCPYLDIPLIKGTNGKPCLNSPSLDRIDSTKGYVKENVLVVSFKANKSKSDSTPDEREQLLNGWKTVIKYDRV